MLEVSVTRLARGSRRDRMIWMSGYDGGLVTLSLWWILAMVVLLLVLSVRAEYPQSLRSQTGQHIANFQETTRMHAKLYLCIREHICAL